MKIRIPGNDDVHLLDEAIKALRDEMPILLGDISSSVAGDGPKQSAKIKELHSLCIWAALSLMGKEDELDALNRRLAIETSKNLKLEYLMLSLAAKGDPDARKKASIVFATSLIPYQHISGTKLMYDGLDADDLERSLELALETYMTEAMKDLL